MVGRRSASACLPELDPVDARRLGEALDVAASGSSKSLESMLRMRNSGSWEMPWSVRHTSRPPIRNTYSRASTPRRTRGSCATRRPSGWPGTDRAWTPDHRTGPSRRTARVRARRWTAGPGRTCCRTTRPRRSRPPKGSGRCRAGHAAGARRRRARRGHAGTSSGRPPPRRGSPRCAAWRCGRSDGRGTCPMTLPSLSVAVHVSVTVGSGIEPRWRAPSATLTAAGEPFEQARPPHGL